ncbi:hypothetical protein Q4555_02570 [Octadecabacter sp. 1_MG-2023]|nr:hypothetical protein [Octadecabacter sp. 1_MG-2023]MDO6733535.1 hypothetical protein [Octadecabacter sp. 1_MG-2023]
MIAFRPDNRIEIEFVSAFVAVAVIYICLVPLEFLALSRTDREPEDHGNAISPRDTTLSLVTSALFIACLFALYLLALIQDVSLDV